MSADPASNPASALPSASALAAALAWAARILRRDDIAAAWTGPSALEGYTVGGLAGHLVRATERTIATLDATPEPGEPARLTEWYLANRFGDGVGLDDPFAAFLRDDGEALGAEGPSPLALQLDALASTIAARLATEPAARMVVAVRTPKPVPIDDYIASRVVEVVVHGDDLLSSVDAGHADPPPPAAVDVAAALLLTGARQRSGDLAVLRALTRAERVSDPADVLRVL